MADPIPGRRLNEMDFLEDAVGAEMYGEKGGVPWRLKVGEPNGLQTLDETGKVPVAQIPASIAELRSDLAENSGADLVGFQQSGTAMAVRDLLSKARDIVHANDRGLLGDGTTDETTGLVDLLSAAAGKLLMLGNAKTYALATATGITIPDNTTVRTLGSKFKRLTAKAGAVEDSDYNIVVGSNVDIDVLEVEAVGGVADIGGVIVNGSNVRIGKLRVVAGSAGSAGNGLAWNALRVGPNSGTAKNVSIGVIEVENWDRAIVLQNIDGLEVGFIRGTTYRRGVYIKDCKNWAIRGGHLSGMSSNATGAAGDNGILIESAASHGSCANGVIENVVIEDAAEHGFRLGGQLIARDIWFKNCKTRNTGAASGASYPPGNNGGCGFKVLGPTSVFGARHQNIYFIDCVVEDVNATSIANLIARSGKSNFAGIQVGKCFNVVISNPVVTKRPSDSGTYGETGNSCFNGIEIIGCQKVVVSNPMIQRPAGSGVYIYDFSDGVNDWGQTDDVEIIGGHVQTPATAGVEVDCAVITMRRISIQGSMKVNAGANTLKVNKSGAGAFVACFADMQSINPSTESFAGLGADWTIRAVGSFVGTNACRNGSFYQDDTNAVLKKRAAGSWTNL